MSYPAEPGVRRSQRDYRLPFKLAVIGEVGRGELSYKQAQRRYGIPGRRTVLPWCRRYASHFVTFQAVEPTFPGTPAVEPSPEQRVKQLETQVREQTRLAAKERKNAQDLNLLLRTRWQVVKENHGIPLPKTSFRRPCPGWSAKNPAGRPLLWREPAGLYQRRQRQFRQASRDAQGRAQGRAVRTRLPRLATRKLRHKIAPLLRVRDGHCGRDALFALLRQHRLLVPQKRSYTKPLLVDQAVPLYNEERPHLALNYLNLSRSVLRIEQVKVEGE
jgi:hypothetical protein